MLYVLGVLAFRIYTLALAGLVLLSVSTLLFKQDNFKTKLKVFGKSILLIPVWPLALFSSSGRKILFNFFERNI